MIYLYTKKKHILKLKLYVNYLNFENFNSTALFKLIFLISHFTVVYLVAKPLIWSEAEGDLVVIETSI